MSTSNGRTDGTEKNSAVNSPFSVLKGVTPVNREPVAQVSSRVASRQTTEKESSSSGDPLVEEYLTKYYGSDEDEDILRASKRTEKFWKAFAAERKDGDEKVPSRFRRKKLPKSERRAVAGSGVAELASASAHPVDFYDIRGEYSDFESISRDALPSMQLVGYNVVGSWPKLKKPFHPSYLTAHCPVYIPLSPQFHRRATVSTSGRMQCGGQLAQAEEAVSPLVPPRVGPHIFPWPPSSTDALPLVLVDGYNVVGSWPKLKKPFLRGNTEEARERLLLEVLPYPRYAGGCWWCCQGSVLLGVGGTLVGDSEEARERLLLEVLPYPRYAGRLRA
ncbi:unnamed protein product [Closterium sp. NIES-65]|nr:unnamed protein product [Closterium sp. NIES-65]